MVNKGDTRYAILVGCSDPRLSAAHIADQVPTILDGLIPIVLSKPGVVRLYGGDAQQKPVTHDRIRTTMDPEEEDSERISLESDIVKHCGIHNPECIIVAAHHDCAGHPGNDDFQRSTVITAARTLAHRLVRRNIVLPVKPAMMELRPNPGWKLVLLNA